MKSIHPSEILDGEEALVASELRYRRLFESAQDGILILDAATGVVVDVNPYLVKLLGYSYDQFVGKAIWELGFFKDILANRDKFLELQRREYVRYENLPLETADGRRREVEFVSNVYLADGQKVIQCNIRDITVRRQAEARQTLALRVLEVLHRDKGLDRLVADILHLIQAQAGIEAIGIRLRDGNDFPYSETCGFSVDSLEADAPLRDAEGKTILECMCLDAQDDRADPARPFFTSSGSFWTNSATDFFASAPGMAFPAGMRHQCGREGYESVALVPMRAGNEVIGLLQLNNHRKGIFTPELLVFFEGIAKSIGIALARQRMESALKESASFLNTLLEAMPVPVFYKDLAGRYTGVNRAFETFFGKTRAELVGKTVFDTSPPDLAKLYHARDLELFQKPGMQAYEAKVQDAQGGMHDVVYHKATYTGADGKVGGMIGVILEITERVQAEADRARLATAVEQSAETIMITDADGSILYVNPAFEKTTGYSSGEAVGQNPRILKSGKQNAEFYRQLWAALKRGEVWSGRFTNQRKDGTLFEEEASISPVRDAVGQIINYVASKRDVTHLAQLEIQLRQAQKMEAVGRLAGGVAHDFNNLLTGIMGYAELCLDEMAPDHPIRKWLEEIKVAVERSAEITRQLLAFARKQTVAPKVVNLNDAVAGMLNLLQRLIGENLQLAWLPGAGLWPIRIDPSQVDQILANLCVNARDAIDGVGQIHLATENVAIDAEFCANRPDALPGDYALLSVTDTGCGMDKETLAQIFEPFFTTKGLGKGTGLGLATVYGIVKQNNGFIHVYSELGKGTAFRIYLPRVATEAGPAAARPAPEAPCGSGETVLVVEDEKSLLAICSQFLGDLGYQVLAAETPGEALEKAKKHEGSVHLLLTDVIMPGMDGKQLARRISALKPGVRVLFMSGYTADVIAQRGVLERNTDFLQKPFTRIELAIKVHEVLQVARAATRENLR